MEAKGVKIEPFCSGFIQNNLLIIRSKNKGSLILQGKNVELIRIKHFLIYSTFHCGN